MLGGETMPDEKATGDDEKKIKWTKNGFRTKKKTNKKQNHARPLN